MRIAFLGKGGAGKTTLASAYANYVEKIGYPTLALDVDVNAHLSKALGATTDPIYIGKRFEELAELLENNRQDFKKFNIKNIPCFGTVPPNKDSHFIKVNQADPVIKAYAAIVRSNSTGGGLSVIAVGPHEEQDFSSSCYHYMLNSVELILHRLADSDSDRVVIDCAAGSDCLGTSLYMVSDLQVFIVEPTIQSLSVYLEYREKALPLNVPLYCALNKIKNEKDRTFLRDRIPGNEIICEFSSSSNIRRYEQGDTKSLTSFEQEIESEMSKIDLVLKNKNKNWNKYYRDLKKLYIAECNRWWNPYYKSDLTLVEWNTDNLVQSL